MRRRYNPNLSEEINAQLDQRAKVVRLQKFAIVTTLIIVIAVAIFLFSKISAFAGTADMNQPTYRYYTSIEIQKGDTLWDLSDTYTKGFDVDRKEYIKEIKELNSLSSDEIHSGQHLVIVYYSHEMK